MAMVAGNIGLKISYPFQFRVFVIPWVRKNSAILCAKGKDYSSSAPVKYVPKKFSKTNKTENCLPIKSLERYEIPKGVDASELRIDVRNGGDVKRSIALDEKVRNQSRMTDNNLLFDDSKRAFEEENGDWEFIEHGLMEETEEFIEEPQEVVEEMKIRQGKDLCKQDVLRGGTTIQDAENLAIKLLATRAFTAVELRKKLNGKKFPSNIVEAVITDFQSRGLINDGLYAEAFSRSRWSTSTWGPRRIKQALFNKGISGTDADKAVKLVFQDAESDGEQESKLGMSKHSMDQLFVQAKKQWLRSQDAPKETRKTRIIRWLQYRGFNWGISSFILKKLESHYPT
ncbi:hypothetical protein Pint_03725 [Pistacia integerrima]|uniref:Uncharacterized protein n=1 Tax=Pistacia integerrima TaxID=434235 RepID=A0ACC0Z225_9ROSI|nr:hypothetical protein Pint_03725 [Pistacia integerrima]